MEAVINLFSIITKGFGYVVAGFIGLIILTIIFGKKIESRFDLEAEFKDDSGREFAEFDVKSWRYEKEGGDYQFKASFSWKDPRLVVDDKISVYLNETLVLEGMVEKNGSIRLMNKQIQNTIEKAQQGDECRVLLNGNMVLKQIVIDD